LTIYRNEPTAQGNGGVWSLETLEGSLGMQHKRRVGFNLWVDL